MDDSKYDVVSSDEQSSSDRPQVDDSKYDVVTGSSPLSKKPAVNAILQQTLQQQQKPEQINTPETEGYIKNAARNVGAGLLGSAQSMLKLAPDLGKEQTGLMKDLFNKPEHRLVDTFDANKAMGVTDQPFSLMPSGERTLAGAEQTLGGLLMPGKFAKDAAPAAKMVIKPITNALKKINPEEIARSVQSHHDALDSEASNMFDFVRDEAKKRGINKVPVDKDIIDQARTQGYFAKTKANKDLIDRAATGDYQAVRDLQKDLGAKSRTALSSPLAAENQKGEEMHELIDELHNQIRHHFNSTGNEDLAKTLDSARAKWANLKNMYYNKKLPAGVRKLVDPSTREMPANIQNLFSKVSKPMNKLREANPFIQNSLNQMKKRENIVNALKYAGTGLTKGLGIAGGLEGINLIKNIFSDKGSQ